LRCHVTKDGRASGGSLRAGFIHIPYLPEQAARHPGAPSMALEYVVTGLRIALETALRTTGDLVASEGRID